MALGKYNRRTVSATTGAVVAGALVNFYYQDSGMPAVAYADAAGTTPISPVLSGANGEVEVFLNPSRYHITVTFGGDIVEDITHEPVVNDIALLTASSAGTSLISLPTPSESSVVLVGSSGFSEYVTIAELVDELGMETANVTESVGGPLYFTAARVLATVLTGLSTATNAIITASDTVLSALGKLQKQITDLTTSTATALGLKADASALTSHTSNTSNPHSVTKTQVGLGNVDNTSDVNKPVSTAQATAIALKKDKSTAFNNKIVVFGSSVANGTGASSAANGWAGLLATALSGTYNVVNKSVGGDTTALLIARFYTDVVPENPSIVIIALSTANEGLHGGTPKTIVEQYLKGIEKLIKMCQAEGYLVVLAGVYPNNLYTATEYAFLKRTEQAMQQFGVPYIGFLGTIDNGSGGWATGRYADDGHPNDSGHAIMFGAIDLTLFNRLTSYKHYLYRSQRQIISYNTSTTAVIPTSFALNTSCKTLTVAARIRRVTGAAGQSLIAFDSVSSPPLRVRNSIDAFEVADSASTTVIGGAVLSSDGLEHLIVISVNTDTGKVDLYSDGGFTGTATVAGLSACTGISFANRSGFGGEANGYQWSDFMIWRTCLRADQVSNLYKGIMPVCSQVLYSPIIDAAVLADARLINLAPSDDDLLSGIAAPLV